MAVEHKKQSPVKYTCGVPAESCTGSQDGRFGTNHRFHSSVVEASLCRNKYMRSIGYVPADGGGWYKPGEPILI